MKNNLKKNALLACIMLLFTIISFAQGDNFKSLIEMKAAYLDQEMKDRGYKFIKTEKSDTDAYQNWYNVNKSKCVTVRISDGRVKSIVDTPSIDCGKSNNNNNSNNNGGGNSKVEDLVGEDAKYAYSQFSKRGYTETKTVKDGANTYKLWKKNDKCKKTTSRDGKITSITNSVNCK